MKKINTPENTECFDNINSAFTYANGDDKYSINDTELQILGEIYDLYDVLKGTPDERLKSGLFSDYLNDALEDSYNEIQEKRRLSDLRETLLLSVNRCPFCGISDADELDHHLPKSIYKALSIYCRNLVPICHKCNNKKRTLDGTQGNKFPQVYFDDYLTEHFFIADTKMISNALVIEFKVFEDNLQQEEYNILDFVFRRINLNERLLKECNIYLSAFSLTVEDSFNKFQIDGVKTFLQSQYQENLRNFGINDWRSALILSLSICDDFCNGGFRHYYQP